MSVQAEEYGHVPVLRDEAVDLLGLQEGDNVVDCTLGLGGHSEVMLDKIGSKGGLIGIERDEDNLRVARERLKKFQNQTFLYHGNFADITQIIEKAGFGEIKAILFDLGMASTHVDEAERGFSFLKDGPLDLRFDRSGGKTAADLVNGLDEKELMRIFWRYGEEKRARRIVDEMVRERKKNKILRTRQLAELTERVCGRAKGKHPATRIFQALRIAINDELKVLEKGLWSAIDILQKGGRIAVISYHSLEDRLTKNIFKEAAKDCVCPSWVPKCQCDKRAEIKIITKKPVTPSAEEIERNSRSRSAKLRVAEKIL